MIIHPFIVGRGRSGQAIARCLGILHQMGEFNVQPVCWIERGQPIRGSSHDVENPSLFISNPHGLHARTILEAEQAGFRVIFCEKPACVSLEEISQLEAVRAKVAIFHGYRQMWGPQTLNTMARKGEFGNIIAIEGRYWRSSTAERVLFEGNRMPTWKNDPDLSGSHDALLDVGTHWADLAVFLMGDQPIRAEIWKSYVNAESEHRDSHVQLTLEFSKARRAFGSVSKTVHGAANHFEIHVLGSRRSASWAFRSPDEILVGEGRDCRIITRKTSELGSKLPPFHGAGWLEGYLEIIRQAFCEKKAQGGNFPSLHENLQLLKVLFLAEQNQRRELV